MACDIPFHRFFCSRMRLRTMESWQNAAQVAMGPSGHSFEGEFVSVVGLNGAGKTTLFNAISGLVPYKGRITWNTADLRGRSPAAEAAATYL
jgi:ABC-type branched-subunit amino acid transport system ATPase component